MGSEFPRIKQAYLEMASQANYRPAAPSDGCGSILLSREEIADKNRLDAEAGQYAESFIEEENTCNFDIGVSDYETNRALVYVVEAARSLCGTQNHIALRLLRMAIREIDEVEHEKL